MRVIKIFFVCLCCAAFCACAAGGRRAAEPAASTLSAGAGEDFARKGKEPNRNYPVFLAGERASAAFKFNIKYLGRDYNAVLTINKAQDDAFKIKMLADFATVVIDADFIDGQMRYQYALGNMFDKKALDFFGDIMRVILLPPADFLRSGEGEAGETRTNYRSGDYLNRYYFKKGLSYPYKLEQIKTIVRKKFLFNNYGVYGDTVLPARIICEDAHNIVAVTLDLINIK
ncbi:MAG: hypothetical protein LBG16_00645 [Elusimicrobiota bacterium]|jgi:hypothetical protein|nr:hypothetical protein [Elusimicrobiota bacterium]